MAYGDCVVGERGMYAAHSLICYTWHHSLPPLVSSHPPSRSSRSVFDMFEMLCLPPAGASEQTFPPFSQFSQFSAFLLAVCCGTSKNCYPGRLAVDRMADANQEMEIGAPADRILSPHRYVQRGHVWVCVCVYACVCVPLARALNRVLPAFLLYSKYAYSSTPPPTPPPYSLAVIPSPVCSDDERANVLTQQATGIPACQSENVHAAAIPSSPQR